MGARGDSSRIDPCSACILQYRYGIKVSESQICTKRTHTRLPMEGI